ncbi:MAG: hypothetical protein ACKPHU_10425, partial [Planctomycetaceae bacterium]
MSKARGEVISVQLALFVEMFGSRDWTPEQYREVGGVDELGVRFLEDSFRREDNRRYSTAAQRVLQELLPVEGIQDTDESQRIKGAMQSRSQLQQAAGGGTNYPDDKFGTLMDILEKSLRLITPTTPDAAVAGDTSDTDQDPAAPNRPDGYYQLTHDYLVPALTDWITLKQKFTPAGRAELKLKERTVAWKGKKERR